MARPFALLRNIASSIMARFCPSPAPSKSSTTSFAKTRLNLTGHALKESNREKFGPMTWLGFGGTCHVFEIDEFIAVKIPRIEEEEPEAKEDFKRELEIWDILSRQPPCPHIVACYLHTEEGTFLENMKNDNLYGRIESNFVRALETFRVVKVERFEPLQLRLQWMSALSQANAHLESLGLAHGDLRPENILLDGDTLKLTDFDNTRPIGSEAEVYGPPWTAFTDHKNLVQGTLGPWIEVFALGSLFYFINYGMESYSDQILGDDPNGRYHDIVMGELFHKQQFPELGKYPETIDPIISRCWHHEYASVADVASAVHTLLPLVEGDARISPKVFESRKRQCEVLVKKGLLQAFSGVDPRGI